MAHSNVVAKKARDIFGGENPIVLHGLGRVTRFWRFISIWNQKSQKIYLIESQNLVTLLKGCVYFRRGIEAKDYRLRNEHFDKAEKFLRHGLLNFMDGTSETVELRIVHSIHKMM